MFLVTMEDDDLNLIKANIKIPRSKDNAFNLRQLSMREFEAFMILLMHEGEKQSILKQLIDFEFDHKSPTKGYDYINSLCKDFAIVHSDRCSGCGMCIENCTFGAIKFVDNRRFGTIASVNKALCKGCGVCSGNCRSSAIDIIGFAYKKKTDVKGRQETRIYVRSTVRKKYEKFMLPTISSLNNLVNDVIKEYSESIKEEEKIRDKFKVYTKTIILALNDLITDTPDKTLSSKRFQKKMYDMIWKYYRSEVLKYEVFSK